MLELKPRYKNYVIYLDRARDIAVLSPLGSRFDIIEKEESETY